MVEQPGGHLVMAGRPRHVERRLIRPRRSPVDIGSVFYEQLSRGDLPVAGGLPERPAQIIRGRRVRQQLGEFGHHAERRGMPDEIDGAPLHESANGLHLPVPSGGLQW